jgi:23S rRNA (adenine2503-C2)-methyltransferase
MDLEMVQQTLGELGEPAYRVRQIWRWAAQGASDYRSMTDVPAWLRTALEDAVPFSTLTVEHESHARDGTVKTLFRTADGRPLEAVLMRYEPDDPRPARTGSRMTRARPKLASPDGERAADSSGRRAGGRAAGRRSLCLSSQSGCPLTCTFCATGQMRFGRNLTAWEILDQALHFRRSAGSVDHAVFMGMGEPMMNLEAVLEVCARLPDIGITHRRTAISTVGWIPGIVRLAETPMPLRLALSLHAADDALRSELMPVNDRYPLGDVIAACERFYARKRRKVFVEYVMLAGVNDGYVQAVQLTDVLDPRVFKVNLIPYNPTDSPYSRSSPKAIAAFRDELERRGVSATVRLTRGRDIDAACGQLAAAHADDR